MLDLTCRSPWRQRNPKPTNYTPAVPHDWEVPLRPNVGHHCFSLLARFFTPQQTDASCSVASVSLVLNAALFVLGQPAVSESWVLSTDKTGTWAKATADDSKHGVGLLRVDRYLRQAFAAKQVQLCSVQTVEVHRADSAAKEALIDALSRLNQGRTDTFVVVNFFQSMLFFDGGHVGHLSVVGAYDAQKGRVLIIDVDPDDMLPYWVSLDSLLAAMNTRDHIEKNFRGYLVVTTLDPQEHQV